MHIKFLIILLLSLSPLYSQTDVNISLLGKLEYPDTELNDIWGYANNGKEYALVGTYNGLSIVDVTNPAKAIEINYVETINSVSDERSVSFIAKDLTFGESEPEETEQLQVKKIAFNEVYNMVILEIV